MLLGLAVRIQPVAYIGEVEDGRAPTKAVQAELEPTEKKRTETKVTHSH